MRKRLLYTIVAIMAVVFSAVIIVLPIHYYKAKHSSYSGENWQLGYAREEITPTDYTQKQYFLSGNLSFVPDIMEQCADGMFVRAVCMSDGRGGLSALAVIDAKAVAHSHVAAIRSELAEFVQLHGIDTVDIIATNSNNTVDTLGLSGDILHGQSGVDADFIEAVKQKTVKAIKNAFKNMAVGDMYFSQITAPEFFTDTREPNSIDSTISRLRFTPHDTAKRPLYIINMGGRPDNMPDNSVLTSDYPFYIEKALNRDNVDMLFVPAATADARCRLEDYPGSALQKIEYFGEEIVSRLNLIGVGIEKKVGNSFSFGRKEVVVPVQNAVYEYIFDNSLTANSTRATASGGYEIITETGFMKMGGFINIALIPGDVFAELTVGEQGFKAMLPENEVALSFSMANDGIGFIVPEAIYRTDEYTITDVYEEVFSPGKQTAPTLLAALESLLETA